MVLNNRYPIYIPSKGRWDSSSTARLFLSKGIPVNVVVTEAEEDNYRASLGSASVITLPFDGYGMEHLSRVRNWIKELSTSKGEKRHWQFDDDLLGLHRRYKGIRIKCDPEIALKIAEDFTDRYDNIAISGFSLFSNIRDDNQLPPFNINVGLVSNQLILNSIPCKFRPTYGEDLDICIQSLLEGYCTIRFNAFIGQFQKGQGGNKAGGLYDLYHSDATYNLASILEKSWPKIVKVKKVYGSLPKITVKWSLFNNKLIPSSSYSSTIDYKIKLSKTGDKINDHFLQSLVEEYDSSN